jgi:hypothetical protein
MNQSRANKHTNTQQSGNKPSGSRRLHKTQMVNQTRRSKQTNDLAKKKKKKKKKTIPETDRGGRAQTPPPTPTFESIGVIRSRHIDSINREIKTRNGNQRKRWRYFVAGGGREVLGDAAETDRRVRAHRRLLVDLFARSVRSSEFVRRQDSFAVRFGVHVGGRFRVRVDSFRSSFRLEFVRRSFL